LKLVKFFYSLWFFVFKVIRWCFSVKNKFIEVSRGVIDVLLGENRKKIGFLESKNSDPDFSITRYDWYFIIQKERQNSM